MQNTVKKINILNIYKFPTVQHFVMKF